MELETRSTDGVVQLPSHARDCTSQHQELRALPLPAAAVIAIRSIGAVEQADVGRARGGQTGGCCRSLVVSTCECLSAVRRSWCHHREGGMPVVSFTRESETVKLSSMSFLGALSFWCWSVFISRILCWWTR